MQTVIPLTLRESRSQLASYSVYQKRTVIGEEVLENGCTLVAADLSFSQQKQDRTPMPATNSMKFRIHASFCSTDETWRIHFLSRLATVR